MKPYVQVKRFRRNLLRNKIHNRADAGQRSGHQPSLSLALPVIATAQLMVVDSTMINVALPPIQRALCFSSSGLE